MINYDEISKLIDVRYWSNTPIEEIPIWELRDVLSHVTRLPLSKTELALVENIVTGKREFSWRKEELSFIGEARVQQLLRLRGYELLCNNLNTFPTSCEELKIYVSKNSLTATIAVNAKYYYYALTNLSNQWPRKGCSFLLSRTTSAHLIIGSLLIYAIYLNVSLFGYAVLAAYISTNCMAIVIHEYWVHNQLTPKNRFFGFIFNYLGLLAFGQRLTWKYTHSYHHTHWKTRQDIETVGMLSETWWRYFLLGSTFKTTKFGDLTQEFNAHMQQADVYSGNNMHKLLPESQFLEKHSISIILISHLILLLALGLVIYTYFVIFQIWCLGRYIPVFNELVTHYNNKTPEEEADTPYLFPICCGTAYHHSHHTKPDTIILGPGWVKYFNVQYYFIKLFYNVSPGFKLS